MKSKKLLGALVVVVLVLAAYFFFSAATPSAPGTQQAPAQSQAQGGRSNTSITVLTGATSGVYYPVGSALAGVLGEMGYKASAVATGATVENINAILSGKGELAIGQIDNIIQAIEGVGAWEGKPKATDLRAMMGLWPDVVQIVTTADSGIRSFADLRGRRVGVGTINSGVEVNARMIFEAHGMSYKDAKVDFLSYGEAVEMMLNGQCDAAFVSSGLGNATIRKLGEARKISFVPVQGEALQRLIQKYPVFVEWSIPKEVYGTDADTTTAAVMNIVLAARSLPGEVVYDMLGGIYSENGLATIGAAHAVASEVRPETALRGIHGTSIQLHPGAERFYREKGLLR